MSRVGLKIIFLLLCFCPISKAELKLSPKTVYELLVYETTNLKTELAETKSLVEGIEKKIEQIGSNVSLIANKVDRFVGERSKSVTNWNVKTITDASDAMFQSDVEMQSAVVRKMLINEKTHLRNTLKKFENKIKEFESDIENRFTLINLKVNETDIIIQEMNLDLESKLNDSKAKVNQRISSIDVNLRSISSKQEELQDTLSDLINATNTMVAAEEERLECPQNVLRAASTYGDTTFISQERRTCYELVTRHKTWYNAETDCQRKGGHLATITNTKEEELVYHYVKSYGHKTWIGLNDQTREEHFEWVSGVPVSYNNWQAGRLGIYKHTFEDCVAMDPITGTWKDMDCLFSYYAHVCEYNA